MKKNGLLLIGFLCFYLVPFAQKRPIAVTGYYAGSVQRLDSFPVSKLTHIIFSFGHLGGNKLKIGSSGDTACIQKMVSYKKQNPSLKVILSLGGWGGCRDCSAVFSTEKGRTEFAISVRELTEYFQTDGIDLDWEYPAIEGYPGHAYAASDRENFTLLIQALRKTMGKRFEISFAAGGFDQFIDSSIDWKKVMRVTDKVYVMSYDLVHGASKESGHHTPLYSTARQKLSADHAVNALIRKGVSKKKIVIGAAFYARMFYVNDTVDRGLYRPGSFYRGISYSRLSDSISSARGFAQFRDETAQAPYAFHPGRKILVTYDDSLSVSEKTKYTIRRGLGGIMFWQLGDDKFSNGLLDALYRAKQEAYSGTIIK